MKRRMKIPMQHMTNEDLSIICFRIMAKSRASQAQPEDEILIPESPVPLSEAEETLIIKPPSSTSTLGSFLLWGKVKMSPAC